MAGMGPSPEATAAVQEVQRVQEVEKVEKVKKAAASPKAAMTKVTSSTEIAKKKLKHILSSRALQIIKETMILEAQKKKKEAQEGDMEAQEGGEKDKKIPTSDHEAPVPVTSTNQNQAATHGRGKGPGATSPQEDFKLPAPAVNRKVIAYTTRSGRVVRPSRKARENHQNTM